jgi:hypothetical protein
VSIRKKRDLILYLGFGSALLTLPFFGSGTDITQQTFFLAVSGLARDHRDNDELQLLRLES